jgi:hypothetical protein
MAKKKVARGGAREGAGRQAVHPEGATVVLTARVPETLVVQLDKYVKKVGSNRSQVVTEAIRAILKTP